MPSIIKSSRVLYNPFGEEETESPEREDFSNQSISQLNGIKNDAEVEKYVSIMELNNFQGFIPPDKKEHESVNIGRIIPYVDSTILGEEEKIPPRELEEEEPPAPIMEPLISQSEREALREEILRDAYREKIKIINDAKEEAQEIFSKAVEQGISDGIELGKKDITEQLEKWNDQISYIADMQEKKLMEINRRVVEISVDVAEKIIEVRMEFDPLTLLPLTKAAVASLDMDEKITICLSKNAPELVEAVKKAFAKKPSIRVRSEDIGKSDVYCETLGEILDASVKTQLENLKEQLKRLNFEDV